MHLYFQQRLHTSKVADYIQGISQKNLMFFIIAQWNKLSAEIIMSKNVNNFKNKYDRHVKKAMDRGSSTL